MHYTTALVALLAASTSALKVTIYTDTKYRGDDATLSLTSGACHDVKKFNDQVSSIRTYGERCDLYE